LSGSRHALASVSWVTIEHMSEPPDLQMIRDTWDAATRDTGAACGMDVVEQAYTDMQSAWFDELGVRADAQ
jgi:hypothetical protein